MDRLFKCLGLFSLFVLVSCTSKKEVKITGVIQNASGSTMYLELQTLDNYYIQDSVVIKNNHAKFKLIGIGKEYPEFYNLVLNKRRINLIADSAMHIEVNVDNQNFYNYQVLYSQSSLEVKKINNLMRAEKLKMQTISDSMSNKLPDEIVPIKAHLNAEFITLKDSLSKFIFQDPRSFVAYYALFQKIFNSLVFDPLDAKDFKCYGAVATSFQAFLPNHYRTGHLYEFTTKALQERRNMEMQDALSKLPTSIPDISLPNVKGDTVHLSSLNGKIVILYFWSYSYPNYQADISKLKKIYAKYASKGLKIYQVSLDGDLEQWKINIAEQKMPWINVCDILGKNAPCVTSYNIQKVPLLYLIDKKLGIYRGDSMTESELDQKIKELL